MQISEPAPGLQGTKFGARRERPVSFQAAKTARTRHIVDVIQRFDWLQVT